MRMSNIKATLMDHMGSDLTVVNAARVSFGKESHAVAWADYDYENKARCGDLIAILDPKDQKLIRYLAKHNHISPFGHCFASFHVKAPVFVARQLVKHSFLRWNEVSRRYVDDEPEFYTPDVWRGRSADKKQGSEGVVESNANMLYYNTMSLGLYNQLLDEGVAPEMARMTLPQSTMTEWWWSGSLDAFARMCNLRLPSDTQYETRVVAEQVSKVLGELFPVSWASLVPLSVSEEGA
jgi:thymidylate synthase (FAD)